MSSEALEAGAAIRKVLLSPGSHPERDPKVCDGCKAESGLAALLAEVARLEQERDTLQHFIDCANTPLMRDVLVERDTAEAALAVAREREQRLRQVLSAARPYVSWVTERDFVEEDRTSAVVVLAHVDEALDEPGGIGGSGATGATTAAGARQANAAPGLKTDASSPGSSSARAALVEPAAAELSAEKREGIDALLRDRYGDDYETKELERAPRPAATALVDEPAAATANLAALDRLHRSQPDTLGAASAAADEPATRKCPNCDGFGKVRDSMRVDPVTCGRCDGRGVIPAADEPGETP